MHSELHTCITLTRSWVLFGANNYHFVTQHNCVLVHDYISRITHKDAINKNVSQSPCDFGLKYPLKNLIPGSQLFSNATTVYQQSLGKSLCIDAADGLNDFTLRYPGEMYVFC